MPDDNGAGDGLNRRTVLQTTGATGAAISGLAANVEALANSRSGKR
jgi:hypothetical protein